jgi:two-component system, OmpR family, sensor kinase
VSRTAAAPGRTPWSLRTRLVVATLALLAVLSLAIGCFTAAFMKQNLIAQLDDDAKSTAVMLSRGAPPEESLRGLPRNSFAIRLDGSGVGSALMNREDGDDYEFSSGQSELISGVEADGYVHDVDLGGALDHTRVVALDGIVPGTRFIVGIPVRSADATTLQLTLIIASVSIVAMVAAAAIATLLVRLTLRPLERVAATASRVAELQLARGDVTIDDRVPDPDTDPRTEVGQVGAALNRLLDTVQGALAARQRSEAKVRQFVADASHELRTPLAAIRGYSELTRRSGATLPDDVRHALGRIESESVRMTTLVEELLLLARLDEGRELERDDVDLTTLATDAVSDAVAAGPDHEFSLDAPDEPVHVSGDGPRLHQVLANLLANARTHTPPGTAVETVIAVDGGEVVVGVTDDGPGIDEALLPSLFERFVRGDESRSRRAGSTGLGLAIVKAIVDSHGGAISVESRPGRTRFEVRLPRTAAPARATRPTASAGASASVGS